MNPTLHILGKYSLFKIVLNKLQSVGRITPELALIISFAIESLPDVLLFFNFWISLLTSCNEIHCQAHLLHFEQIVCSS